VAITVAAAALVPLAQPAVAGTLVAPLTQLTGVMRGISCVPGQCVAVGSELSQAAPKSDEPQAWTLSHGKWDAVVPPGGPLASLTSVSCPQLGTCIAVGFIKDGANYGGFAEQLLGGDWHATPLPAGTPILSSVSCVSTTWCMAVSSVTEVSDADLALEWNGTSWLQVAPAPGTLEGQYGLGAVSCVSSTFCMAVGFSSTWGLLADAWNGSSWSNSLDESGNAGGVDFLSAVSCPTAAFCAAVGSTGGIATFSVAAVWRGGSWTRVSTPGESSGYLNDVSCTSAASCIAVGTSGTGLDASAPLRATVLQWQGTAWTSIRGAALGKQSSLSAVGCSQASWCAAVGAITTNAGTTVPLVERWNGASLARMFAPQ